MANSNRACRERMKILDVERQFSCYGGYRKSAIHVLVHAMFVWPMLFGIMLLLSYGQTLFPKPLWVDQHVPIEINQHMVMNYAFVAAALYSLLYIYLDPRAGFLAAVLVMGCWMGGCAVSRKLPWDPAWKIVLAGEVVCFTAQTVGREPPEVAHAGVVENFCQMLVLGPYFVLLELLDFVGYMPYQGFRSRVERYSQSCPNARCCSDTRCNCCNGESCSSSDSDCCE